MYHYVHRYIHLLKYITPPAPPPLTTITAAAATPSPTPITTKHLKK
jgi:hypothetical protein